MINWKRPAEESPIEMRLLLIQRGQTIDFGFAIYDSDSKYGMRYISDYGKEHNVNFWCYAEDLLKTLPNKGE